MNSVWLSLLWKEWREQRWKMAALTGMLLAVPNGFLLLDMFSDSFSMRGPAEGFIGFTWTLLVFYVPFAGFFIGMTAAGGERSRQTMRFLQALPNPQWQTALIKMAMALVTAVIPVVLYISVSWLVASIFDPTGERQSEMLSEIIPLGQPWGISNWYRSCLFIGVVGTASIVVWMAAGGVNRSDEVSAAAAGLFFITIAWGFFGLLIFLTVKFEAESLGKWLLALKIALPGGPVLPDAGMYAPGGKRTLWLMVPALLGHLAVLGWYICHFGKVVAPQSLSKGKQISDFLSYRSGRLPLRTQIGGIVWKQVRETGPLALLAVIMILVVIGVILYINRRNIRVYEVSQILALVTLGVGVLVTLVAGIGVFYEDYAKGVENFWRSRPINLHAWFILKVLTGFAVLIFFFGSLLLVANWLGDWKLDNEPGLVPTMLTMFVLTYILSLTGYALVRQPLFAVIIVVACLLLFVPMAIAVTTKYWRALGINDDDIAMYFGVVFIIAAFVLAWQAVVRNWGWKQHR